MFEIGNGTMAALSNMNDDRAYYTFGGDLDQMGSIYTALLNAGFNVVKNNVYPGFPENKKEEYIRALKYVWEHKINGWWSQREALIEHGICTEEEFMGGFE